MVRDRKIKTYKIKSLVDGYKLGLEYAGKILVACKNDKGYTHITYKNQIMKLPPEPVYVRSFPDKFGRGSYFLGYYEWQPMELFV